jgi:hypothetical protein
VIRWCALARKPGEGTIDGLWTTIGRLISTFNPTECRQYFADRKWL